MLEMTESMEIGLSQEDVNRILKEMGDRDSIEVLDYMLRNLWEDYQ